MRVAAVAAAFAATAQSQETDVAQPNQLSLPMCVLCGRVSAYLRHRTLAKRSLPEPWG